MKKLYLLLGIAFFVATCAKEPVNSNQEVNREVVETPIVNDVIFSASFAENPSVKTVLDGEGTEKSVLWVAGDDVISILWDGGSTTSAATSSGATTEFSASVDAKELYYGVYPSSVTSSFTSSVLSVTIPSAQHGTFAEANIAVASATSSSLNFSFKNLCALAKLTLTRDDIAEIRFAGAGSEVLAGTVNVSLDGSGVPSCDASGATATEIVLTPSSGTAFAAGTYYFSMIPQSLSSGLSITLTTSSGKTVMTRVGSKAASLERSAILNFGTLDTSGTPTKLQLTFDFTGTPQDGWPTANAAVAHVDGGTTCTYTLDNTAYKFVLADANGASGLNVFWPTTDKLYLRYEKRYVGLPKLEGYKLVKAVCTCVRWSSGTVPKIGIVDQIFDKDDDPYDGTHDSHIFGALQEWGATGSVHTYDLSGTSVNTMYYLCSKNPSGFNQLVLTYTK